MNHKILGILLLFAISMLAWDSAFGKGGCSYQGTWIGFEEGDPGNVYFISQVTGPDQTHGNTIVDIPGYDVTLNGMFPTATAHSDLRGVWERTGGNTFAHTAAAFVVDADGNALYILKYLNRTTIVDDCNTEQIWDITLELYWPYQNPYDPETESFFAWPGTDHEGYRMQVDLP